MEQHNYNYLDKYLKERFNSKVFKVALNGNFSCPNRDGTKGVNGCLFCSSEGSGEFAGNPSDLLSNQFLSVKNVIHSKWPKAKYIAYFQANSNTYKSLDELKKIYEEAISLDSDIVCISIATRCDCLENEIINYLGELNKKIPVWVELGLQSSFNKTLEYLQTGYTLEMFNEAVNKLSEKGIEVIAHIINGLPYETEDMMIKTAKYLNTTKIKGVKIHSLFIVNDSKLYQKYMNNEFSLLTMEEYVKITARQISILNSDIIIHRVSGDPPKDKFVAPTWCLKKLVVMNEIDKYMRKENLSQNKKPM